MTDQLDLAAEVKTLSVALHAKVVNGEGIGRIYFSKAMHDALVKNGVSHAAIGAPTAICWGTPFTVTQLLDDLGRHWWVSSHVGP